MLLILLLCGPAWLALGTEAAPAQRPELVTVALHEGAQGLSFDLFHPQLPINKEETSTTVPVIHLPADREDDEKVAADAIFEMFPQDLLENNKKVRPVDVKIIEHDGYIDYEIEFVELPDYYDYEDYYGQDYDFGQKVEELELTTTTTESSTSPDPKTPELTFVNLLKKARNKHRQIQRESINSNLSSELRTDNTKLALTDRQEANDEKYLDVENKPSPSTTPVPKQAAVGNFERIGRSTTTGKPEPSKVTDLYGQHQASFSATTTVDAQATTFEVQTTRPEFSESPRSSSSQLKSIANNEEEETQSEYFEEYQDDFLGSDSHSHLTVFTSVDASRSEAETETETESHTTVSYSERIPKKIDSRDQTKQLIVTDPSEDKEIIDTTGGEYTEVNPGQYHETNPGQYHEDNPGQYHEANPGQYHEANPGQYHEVNPGQYHEVNPGQYHLEDKDIQVSVDDNREDDSRTYDVRANAGDFIIGEVGRIDINSGQTLEGVRYTALESEVDYEKIKEILEMYFGARTATENK